MLAAAHEPDLYAEGLKQISASLMFFQANPVMMPRNLPDMPRGMSQLAIKMINLKFENLGQLWGGLGGRYLPSGFARLSLIRNRSTESIL